MIILSPSSLHIFNSYNSYSIIIFLRFFDRNFIDLQIILRIKINGEYERKKPVEKIQETMLLYRARKHLHYCPTMLHAGQFLIDAIEFEA